MIVLGIDPGLRLTGYAAVRLGGTALRAVNGSGGVLEDTARRAVPPGADQVELLEAGVFRLSPKLSVADRLVELDRDLREALSRLSPAAVAVEKLYAHYKHPTTAITMAHARGVIFLAIRAAQVPITELASTEVKKSLTGHGHASKRQMQDAVQAQLRLKTRPEPADVADAIAIALCAARRAAVSPQIGRDLSADDADLRR